MKKLYILTISTLMLMGVSTFATDALDKSDLATKPVAAVTTTKIDNFNYAAYQPTNPLDVVAKPNFYLNKNIKISGKFDKFSTLGLDYAPAMRSSDNYIAFLIQRPDINDHNLPLSEMKCFLPREEAEKYIELNSGDRIEFYGTVFSNALGDVWIDVKNFKPIDNKKTVSEK